MKKFILTIASFLLVWGAVAQNVTVSGRISDENGEPLPAAALLAGGDYTTSDVEGHYSLSTKSGAAVVVSYMGYEDYTFTVPAGGGKVDISMTPSQAIMLDETVVIGYGTTTKKETTGSVASLKSENLDLGSYINAGAMLQGKVAGLTVVNPDGGDPNASYQFLLRGTNTLEAGQGPLIIIDGVADADIRNINFQEVESIDVLKDGSAAAIYGTRGTNGVVIITTRRARSGSTSVEYDGQVSVQAVQSRAMPMTAEEFKYTIEHYAPAKTGSLYGYETDWFDEITRTPISHKHSLAVSGGNDRFSHRTVLNVEQNQGLQKKNEASKYLIKTNIVQHCLEGWLDMDYNLSYVKRVASPANYGAFRQAFMRNPTEPVYDEAATQYGGYFTLTESDYSNPVAMINERSATNETSTVAASVRATLNILPIQGLKWDNFLSYSDEKYFGCEYKTSYYPGSVGKKGVAYTSANAYDNLQWESTLQYSRMFGDHSFQGILGYTWQKQINWSSNMENYGFDSDFYKYNNMGIGTALKQGLADMYTNRSSNRYIAFFGRVIWNYKEKYLASVSLRRDGSTRFGKDHKWGWFPAVSLGWRMSQEEWLKDVEWLSELKLRAGYGVTGNQDFANYKSLMLMSSGTSFYYNGEWINSYAPASNANPDLRWERKSEFNVGADFSFLNGRLGGTLDYYYRLTTDLLYEYNVPVPPYDYKTLFTNVGSISNTGVELSLYATPVKTRNLVWTTSLVAAHNRNKLIKFTNEEFQNQDYEIGWIATPVGAYVQRLIEGESLGSFYAPRWDHVGPDGRDVLKDEFAGKVPVAKWSRIGSAYPDATLGWSNTLRYRQWTFGMTLRGAIGGKVFNSYRATYENLQQIGLRNILASWLDDTSYTGEIRYSDKYIEDASYLKLDNVSVSYDLPYHNQYLHSARVFVSGQNLCCLTGYKGVDPEVSLSGLTPGIESTSYYPRTMTFSLGVNLTF
ncbi:MAG: SusC/RagA family TonB-linked outer membrane protein [Bacteroidales bacterium]|nr:SusC/RagA family TonB-linked outer membrane protein [Bacteroidales bacterium]MBQ9529635.1 SusC/RagA family TonB-linked outer membrane protein [Bacteroidales bacterium]